MNAPTTETALQRFGKFLWRVATWPYRTIKSILKAIVLFLVLWGCWTYYDFAKNAHQYEAVEVSGDVSALPKRACEIPAIKWVRDAVPTLESFKCLEKKGQGAFKPGEHIYFFSIAAAAPREQSTTGHAWVIWTDLAVGENGEITVYTWWPQGFGGNSEIKWPADKLAWINSKIDTWLPEYFRKTAKDLALALWYGGMGYEEAPNRFSDQPQPFTAEDAKTFLPANVGNSVAAVVMVQVDAYTFREGRRKADLYKTKDYHLLINDCTTYARSLASVVGLYVPPRFLFALPYSTVKAIGVQNAAEGS